MVSQACYSPSDGRRYGRPYPLYYPSTDRRFQLSSHDARAVSMTDHQLDSDSAPQRKRIAVACGRCRKRKIRCSGDTGQGQPCSNCKNAGVEPCQFLRVLSREAPIRNEPGDFGYNVGDARLYASRTPVGAGLPYTQDLPAIGSSDVLASYRGGSTYSYTPAPKAYYSGLPPYGAPYADDFEFPIGVPSQSVLAPEPVGMLSGQWSSGARAKPPSFGGVYMDADGSYGGYSGSGLMQRATHGVGSDGTNFSFSGVAASLPLPTASASDRLLPNPTARSSALPYPSLKSSVTAPTTTASSLADVATAASYAGGFDGSGLSYPQSAASSGLASQHSSSSRANSDGYAGSESMFSEQERSFQSQGPAAFDMTGYTAEPRGGSGGSSGGSGALSNGQQQQYVVPGDNPHRPAHHSATAVAYLGDTPSTSPVDHRRPLAHPGHASPTGSATTALGVPSEDRHAAVASRQ